MVHTFDYGIRDYVASIKVQTFTRTIVSQLMSASIRSLCSTFTRLVQIEYAELRTSSQDPRDRIREMQVGVLGGLVSRDHFQGFPEAPGVVDE